MEPAFGFAFLLHEEILSFQKGSIRFIFGSNKVNASFN
jgi:hypothetical protein